MRCLNESSGWARTDTSRRRQEGLENLHTSEVEPRPIPRAHHPGLDRLAGGAAQDRAWCLKVGVELRKRAGVAALSAGHSGDSHVETEQLFECASSGVSIQSSTVHISLLLVRTVRS